jgi:hypothetical protein
MTFNPNIPNGTEVTSEEICTLFAVTYTAI